MPITEEEIAEAAVDCWRAGAAIVHLHVRNEQGKVTCDPARYAKARDLIRAAGSDVIINMSTGGGAGQTTDEQRIEPVDLAPEIASFDCGSLNFGQAHLRQLAEVPRRTGGADGDATASCPRSSASSRGTLRTPSG